MIKIYNSRAVTRQERFQNAVVMGVLAALGITVIYSCISSFFGVQLSIVYLAMGYAIGFVIKKYGKGVQPKFSVLAAVLAVVCFIFCDLITMYGFTVLFAPFSWPYLILNLLSYYSNFGLLSLLYRVCGVIVAYQNARIM